MNPDQTIGRYTILERVGRGGMGVLYRGMDPVLDREVAIKVMSADFATGDEGADQESRGRFFREARAAARLQHRNIVTIFEFAEADGVPYIVMEFLRGRSLAARMRSEPPLTLDEKIDIVTELCTGLEFAHEHNVIHRDVKPGNVWLLEDGTVKLLDFGIAKVSTATFTRHGEILGSASYMAPEQLGGHPVDARADVFAASVVLYELLAGRRPFESDSPTATHLKIMREDPPSLNSIVPDLPQPLAAVVTKGLQKNPADRYQTAADLGADLQLIRMALQSTGETVVDGNLEFDETVYGEDRPSEGTIVTDDAMRRNRTMVVTGPTRPLPRPIPAAPRAAAAAPAPSNKTPWIVGLAVSVVLLAGVGWYSVSFLSRLTGTAANTPAQPDALSHVPAATGRVTSKPPATLRIDTDLPPAEQASVRVEATGTYPFEITDGRRIISAAAASHAVSVAPGQVLRLRATTYLLDYPFEVDGSRRTIEVQAPELGRLTVRSSMETCQVLVNGHELGFPPIDSQLVAAGTYSVQLKCPDGQIVRGSGVAIVAGQTSIAKVQ
jgi:serine/threonine protein kinase